MRLAPGDLRSAQTKLDIVISTGNNFLKDSISLNLFA